MTINLMLPMYPDAVDCRFDDLAKGFQADVCMYAVSLSRDSERQYGLILQGYHKIWFSTQRLVKVGTFVISGGPDLPPITSVD